MVIGVFLGLLALFVVIGLSSTLRSKRSNSDYLFADTISTADSLILSCSAALTRDIAPEPTDNIWVTKAGTLLVTAVALTIALVGPSSVFRLVLLAVSVLASSFGPLLVLYATGRRLSQLTAVLMVVVGAAMAIIWRESGLGAWIYEIVPGMLAGLLVYLAAPGSSGDGPTVDRGEIRGP
jgi:Na+/proline symporter